MATLYINKAKKCEKMFFFQIINGMVPFGQGVATPMLSSISSKHYKYSIKIDIKEDFKNFLFFEISGSSCTTMSQTTFFYLVKQF